MIALRSLDYEHIALDEAGRGALAGPLAVCAVVLRPGAVIPGLRESKDLRPNQIPALFEEVLRHVVAYNVGFADVDEINRYGIEAAQRMAYGRAFGGLAVRVPINSVVIDGNVNYLAVDPNLRAGNYRVQLEVGGDAHFTSLAAASVIAKYMVDEQMRVAAGTYPEYGWDVNCGYWSPRHLRALRSAGPSPLHRKNFGPVADVLSPQLLLWEDIEIAPSLEQMRLMDELVAATMAKAQDEPGTIRQMPLWRASDLEPAPVQGVLWPSEDGE